MNTYVRGNRQYLDLGVIDGKRIRLSQERILKLYQLHGLLNARVRKPVRVERAMQEYLIRCTHGRENKYGKPKSPHQADRDKLVLERLAARFPNRYVHQVTNSDLRAFLAERGASKTPRGTDLTTATLNREITTLKAFFHFMVRQEHCQTSPATDIKQSPEHNMRTSWATNKSELARWREQLSGTPRDIFDTLFGTLLRVGECLKLKPDDYDLYHKTLLIRNPKEQRPAEVPVNSQVQPIIESRLNGPWLFPTRNGAPYAWSGIRSVFYRARDRAGIRKFRIHDLRRSGATAMLQEGVDIRRIQAMLRHKDLSVTMRYLAVPPEGMRDAAEAISGWGATQIRHSSEPVSVSVGSVEVGDAPTV